ncbi:MAG: phosphotransferase [Steroidobacteraceae bacterium]|nr:phosphotransferase [Steroidobacteraceae bacterium]
MSDERAHDSRLRELERWLTEDLGFGGCPIAPASMDASFRRYFRVKRDAESYIVMDAPPEKEALGPYLRVAGMLAGLGLNVPRLLARDAELGFALITDLGARQYLPELRDVGHAQRLYASALDALLRMQTAGRASAAEFLPRYDQALLMREMGLFETWFLGSHLRIEIDAAARAMLQRLFAALVANATEQPFTFVHRDYHSRNLMVTEENNPGILDFQDALYGPLTYDLVSLLKDCYVAWPRDDVRAWALGHRDRLRAQGFALPRDDGGFLRWFDLMGLQRHIKVLGIFCRLYYRDGKRQYLGDLQRVLYYVREVAQSYPQTVEFAGFIAARVDGVLGAAQARAQA